MPLRFDHPDLLWLLLAALPIAILGQRSLTSLTPWRRRIAISLRLLVLFLLVSMLAGVQLVYWHDDLTVVTVVDQSESVRRFVQPPPSHRDPDGALRADPSAAVTSTDQWIAQWVQRSSARRQPDDRLGVVTYDGRPTVRHLPSTRFNLSTGSFVQPVRGTDSAAAVRLAMALFTADRGKRIVLISDGNDTTTNRNEDLLSTARQARAVGIPIDVLPLEYRVRHEVVVEGLYAPIEARQGQTVALRVVLRATGPTSGQLYLKHDRQLVDLNGPLHPGTGIPVRVDQWAKSQSVGHANEPPVLAAGKRPVKADTAMWVRKIQLPLVHSGANRFEAVFEPAASEAGGGDTVIANNYAEALTLVHGKTRVLFVDRRGSESSDILAKALGDRRIELARATPDMIPARLGQLLKYDALILQNVPADAITIPQQKLIVQYANELGGGLVMVGGPDSFAAGGWTGSPVDRILPVDCQIPNQTVLPSGALVLVLDRSGSMGDGAAPYTKQQIANEAAIMAMNTLYPHDMVGVIAFDRHAQWIVPMQSHSDPRAVAQRVRQIKPGGGTHIYPALEQAYNELAQLGAQDMAVKHIILLTDGHGLRVQYDDLIRKIVQARITVSTIGVGDEVNGRLLARLAHASGGTYHPVSDPNDLPQLFVREARTIRKNLVKEGRFDPQLVPTGSPITAGLGGVPPLEGFVLTAEKRDPRVYTPIVGPEGEPIFAHWQVGLGRTAAFTSDATGRWAKRWLQWNRYADFWTRTVRFVARPAHSRDFNLLVWIDGDSLRIRLDSMASGRSDQRGQRSLHRQVIGGVLGPDDTTIPVKLQLTGPGTYEGRAPATKEGGYIVSLFVDDHGGAGTGLHRRRMIVGGCTRQRGAELRDLRSNRTRLEQVAALTGGRVLQVDRTAHLFDRSATSDVRSVHSPWPKLLRWLLAVFLLDVAVRRIAWDPALHRASRRIKSLGGLSKPREAQPAATLATLKQRTAQLASR